MIDWEVNMETDQTQTDVVREPGTTTRRALLVGAGAAGILATTFSKSATAYSTSTQHTQEAKMKAGRYTTPDGVEIYFKDWGTGPVVTFSHGWPLSADAWDAQMLFLAQKG